MSTRKAPQKRTHQIWTPEEVSTLEKLLRKRTPADEIGELLKRSGKSIRRKAEVLGLSYALTYDHNRVAAAKKSVQAKSKKNGQAQAKKNGHARNGVKKTAPAKKKSLPKASRRPTPKKKTTRK